MVAVLLLALAACTPGSAADEAAPAPTAPPPPTSVVPAPTVPDTPPPGTALDRGRNPLEELSFGEYQQEVAAADQASYQSLQTLAKAGSFNALRSQAAQSVETISGAAARLEEIVPPEHLRDQHAALIASLQGLVTGLQGLAGRIDSQELCAAPALLAELKALPATGQIRAATHSFAAAGGGRVTFVPQLGGPQPQRPANGQHLRPKETSGLGELTIENFGIGRDAVVTLARGNSAVLSVYVRGNSTHTVTGIGDAGYTVFFSHGREWSPSHRAFARDCDFGRFDDTIEFETTSSQYTIWEVSLRSEVGGNAPTTPVDPGDVPK